MEQGEMQRRNVARGETSPLCSLIVRNEITSGTGSSFARLTWKTSRLYRSVSVTDHRWCRIKLSSTHDLLKSFYQ